MSTALEQHATIVRNYVEAIWNEQNVDRLDEFMNENAVFHSNLADLRGLASIKKHIQKFIDSFSDLSVEILDTIVQNNKLASRWKVTGTCETNFFGISVKKQNVNYEGISFFHFANNKIQECWVSADSYGLLTQIGAVPNIIKKEKIK
jgi:steroid delta-isomerase-like uncharacterized protein